MRVFNFYAPWQAFDLYCSFCDYRAFQCRNYIPPELEARYHSIYGKFASSLLFSGYFLGALATMLPFGILADRIGNLRLIGLGIIFTIISGLIIFYLENLWILIISRFIEGATCGSFFPAEYPTLSRCKEPARCLGLPFFIMPHCLQELYSQECFADIYLKGAVLTFIFMAFLVFSSLGGGSGIAMVGYALSVARMDADRGLAMELFNTTIYAGLSLLPIVAGLLIEVLSFEELFLINGCILAGALLLKD